MAALRPVPRVILAVGKSAVMLPALGPAAAPAGRDCAAAVSGIASQDTNAIARLTNCKQRFVICLLKT